MNVDKIVKEFLLHLGLHNTLASLLSEVIIVFLLMLIAVIINQLCKNILIGFIKKLTKRTGYKFDDLLVDRNVIKFLVYIIAPLLIYLLLPAFLDEARKLTSLLRKGCVIYIIFCFIMALNGLILVLYDNYNTRRSNHQRPIRGFVQVVQVFLFFVGFIVMISVIINRSPAALFAGLGASAAILSLVFKDIITGFIAGVQLSLNDMVRPGDWVTLPDNKTDGIVQEITLITVKIQNFDKSVSTVPPTVLVTNTFKNWREMLESSGRLVQKLIWVDKASVKFVTPELVEKIQTIPSAYADDTNNPDKPATNTQLFREYMMRYLADHPDVNKDMGLKISELETTDRGVPIQLFFFSRNKEDQAFEKNPIGYLYPCPGHFTTI